MLRYGKKLTAGLEKPLPNLLWEQLAFVIKDWDSAKMHYTTILTTYLNISSYEYSTELFCHLKIENQTSPSGSGHFSLIETVLSAYHRCADNVIDLIGDDCATKKALWSDFDCPSPL